MMTSKIANSLGGIACAAALCAAASPAFAQKGIDEPFHDPYTQGARRQDRRLRAGRDELRPHAGLARGAQEGARALGVKIVVRDPNWNTNAGAQAVTTLISEKPDVIVVHNPDVQTYAKLLQKAETEGIYIVQINMRSAFRSVVYVGADWIEIGEGDTRRWSTPARASRTRSPSCRARCRPPPAPTR